MLVFVGHKSPASYDTSSCRALKFKMATMDKTTLIELLPGAFVLYVIGLYVYRMYFDRLSHIPGPKLAAASLWYEFYYDVVLKGRYTYKIRELHEEYGKRIAISS